MKKTKILPTTLLFLLLLSFPLSVRAKEKAVQAEEKNPEIIVLNDVSGSSIALFDSLFSQIPDEIRNSIKTAEIRIFLVPDGSYTEGHAGMYIVSDFIWSGRYFHTKENVTNSPQGYIAINTSSKSKIRMSVVHEVGHFVDEQIGIAHAYSPEGKYDARYYSQNPEFTEIFLSEGPLSGYPSWNLQDEQEYFAESFRMLIEQPEKLDKLPKTKEFMIRTLSDFYGPIFDGAD